MTRGFFKSTTAVLSIALALPSHAVAQAEGRGNSGQLENLPDAAQAGQMAPQANAEKNAENGNGAPQEPANTEATTGQNADSAIESLQDQIDQPRPEEIEAADQQDAADEEQPIQQEPVSDVPEALTGQDAESGAQDQAAQPSLDELAPQANEPEVAEEPAQPVEAGQELADQEKLPLGTSEPQSAPEVTPADQEQPAQPQAAEDDAPAEEDPAILREITGDGVADQSAPDDPTAEQQESLEAVSETAPADAPPEIPENDPETELLEQQAQAEAAAAASQATQAAQDGADEGEIIETQETVITEDEARSSSEEFLTGVNETASDMFSDQQTQSGAAPRVAPSGDDGNDLLRTLGTAAAIGLGAYAVGQILDNGSRVVSNSGDRVVLEQDGRYRVIKDDDTLLRRPGSQVRTQTFSDGSTRTIVTTERGAQTVTIRSADGQVLRRERILPNGESVVLFDDTRSFEPVNVRQLSRDRVRDYDYSDASEDELRRAIEVAQGNAYERSFSLNQIRYIDAVRHQVPVIALDQITFETGSSVIRPAQAEALSELGTVMRDAIAQDPSQVFLIEGHTDTVGPDPYNLALSDRRAESVALALTEYFDVPPANMIVQGYGESDLKVRRAGDIRANRRAAVRNITPLLERGG